MYEIREPVEKVRQIRGRLGHPVIDADAHVVRELPRPPHDGRRAIVSGVAPRQARGRSALHPAAGSGRKHLT